MKPYKEYFKIPEGFNQDYITNVIKAIYPFLFAISIIMVAISIIFMGIAYLEIIKNGSIFKNRFLEELDPKVKLKIGAIMFLTSVAYSRWYIVIFFPDGILNIIL